MGDETNQVELTGFVNIAYDGFEKTNDNATRVALSDVSENNAFGSSAISTRDGITKKNTMRALSSKTLPFNNVGLFSYVFSNWFSPLMWKMLRERRKPLTEDDIWQSDGKDGVKVNMERINHLWQDEISKHGLADASFYRVWIRFVWVDVVKSVLLGGGPFAISHFILTAVLLRQMLVYLLSPDGSLWEGLSLVLAVMSAVVLREFSYGVIYCIGYQTGTRFCNGVNGLLYDKILRLKSLNEKSAEIVNLFSIDSDRIYAICPNIMSLLYIVWFLIIAVVNSYILVGYWCLVIIGTLIVCSGLQVSATRAVGHLRRICMKHTNARIRYMKELLHNMKFIKMYAWEQPFKDAVQGERHKEQKYLLWSATLTNIGGSIVPSMATITSVVTLSAYAAAGNELEVTTVFALIGTMHFLRIALFMIPMYLWSYEEAKASLQRIQDVLKLDEYELPNNVCKNKANAVELTEATFVWDEGNIISGDNNRKQVQTGAKLNNINLNVAQGQLIGICGVVGSGKSSLLSAILGRMSLVKGHLAVNGKVAYVPQQAWIFNGTVRENILFGRKYEEYRFKEVVRCCGLDKDISMWDKGDETEIGERGITLSGGQKQRVNMARAAYSNSDIYILDDPLSALDTTVGKEVFYSCIRGFLKGKTVILATHQLQYFTQCDNILVIEDGNIVEAGQHTDILQARGVYADMFNTFLQTTLEANQDNATGNSDKESKCRENGHKSNGKATESIFQQTNQNHHNDNLVKKEETEVGHVSLRTYATYVKAAGGLCLALIVLIIYFIGGCALLFNEWWITLWMDFKATTKEAYTILGNDSVTNSTMSQTTEGRGILATLDDNAFLLVYASSLGGTIIILMLRSAVLSKVMTKASNVLHSKCLSKVLDAPVLFFESNPTGRILNRFTKDLDEGLRIWFY